MFREYLLRHLPVGELAKHFRDDIGRPSKDLYAAIGALILQQLHDLTDKQTVEAVALNIAWHYALDIRNETDAYLRERTLRNYRRQVIKSGLEQILFRTLTDRLINAVGVNTDCQRLDSTAIRPAIRGLTRLGIFVEATSKFLGELKRTFGELHDQVDSELIRRHVDRHGDGCFANTKPSESKRRLPEAAKDVHELIEQVCNVCPNKSRCMVTASGRSFARYRYTHDRVRQRQRRLNEKTETFRDRYRWRAGIEAAMSRFKQQMGMAHLRVRGMAKISYVAFLRALGLNIHRVAAYRAVLQIE